MLSLAKATVLFLALGLCGAIPHEPRAATTSTKTTSTTSSKTTSTTPKTTSTTSKTTSTTSKTTSTTSSKITSTTSSKPTSTASSSSSSASVSAAANAPAGFVPGVKWQIEIQDPVDIRSGMLPSDAKVVDVDLFLASKDATLIPALHNAGITVLCYFNAGAVQTTDCDWPTWSSGGLWTGKHVSGYSEERYVDITNSSVVALHKARIDLANKIGCDGIDPDNIDTYELSAKQSIGKQITQAQMVTFLSTLAAYAHSKTTPRGKPMMIGQKNAVELTAAVHGFMDFAISENCVGSQNTGSNLGSTDAFCDTFRQAYVDSRKPVFDIEYPASLSDTGESSSSKKRRGVRSRRGLSALGMLAGRDSYDVDPSDTGCSAGTSASDMSYYCAMASGNSTGISRILKLDNDDYGLNGCTQYCAGATSFLLPTYESNDTNSCCFGSDC